MTALLLALACTGAREPFAPPAAELVIEQLALPGTAIGEAALVVGPERAVLVDVGNDSHTAAVLDALDHHLGQRRVAALVLTHFHADHVGGLDDLADAGLVVEEAVWHRGDAPEDDANASEWAEVREVLEGPWAGLDRPLCDAEGCVEAALELGGGATLRLMAADGRVPGVAGQAPVADEENARSVVGVVTLGEFTWAFAGDLTGGGKDTPDAEGWLAARLPPGPAADVLKVNHHGIASSTSEAWLDRWLPADGADHNAVVGANGAYLSAPDEAVLERLGPRLRGGFAWVTLPGSLADPHPRRRDADGGVVVRVLDGGARYTVSARDEDGEWDGVGFDAL